MFHHIFDRKSLRQIGQMNESSLFFLTTGQQIYFRMFARGQGQNGKKKNGLFGMKKNGQRNNGQRPFTRAEALLVMLENNGIQPESLQTLRNTVTNQDVKQIAPEDHTIE